MTVTMRRASVADAARMSVIASATFVESFADDHDGVELVDHVIGNLDPASHARTLADPDTAAWLLEEVAGSPIGYAVMGAATCPGARAGDVELKRLYVLSKWHGRGLGNRLYDAVVAEGRARRGAARLLLSVYVANVRAQRFYAARGHVQIGRWIFPGFAASEDYIYAADL